MSSIAQRILACLFISIFSLVITPLSASAQSGVIAWGNNLASAIIKDDETVKKAMPLLIKSGYVRHVPGPDAGLISTRSPYPEVE